MRGHRVWRWVVSGGVPSAALLLGMACSWGGVAYGVGGEAVQAGVRRAARPAVPSA